MEEFIMQYGDFSGGLDIASSLDNLNPACVYLGRNMDFSVVGAVRSRQRLKRFPINVIYDTESISQIFRFQSKMLDTNSLIFNRSGQIFIRKVVDSVPTSTSFDSGCTILSAVTFWSPSLQKDIFIYSRKDNATGDITLKKFDGTTLSDLSATAPKGKYLTVHRSFLMVSGVDTAPDATFISKLGDPEDFSEGVAIRYPTWEGDSTQATIEYQDKMYAFMQNSIQVIAGDIVDEFATFPAVTGQGALCPNAITANGSMMIFIGQDKKVWIFNGQQLNDISSQKVRPYFENIDWARLGEVQVKAFGANVYFYIPVDVNSGLANCAFFVYDTSRDIWTQWDLPNVLHINVIPDDAGVLALGVCDSTTKGVRVVTDDYKTQDSSSINTLWFRPKPAGIDSYANKKKFKRLFLRATCMAAGGKIALKYWTDSMPDGVPYQFIEITPGPEVIRIDLIDARGRMLYLDFEAPYGTTISDIVVHGKMKKIK